MTALSPLAAAVFDLDGTLLDQESAADAASIAWAHEHGIHDDAVADRWRQIATKHYRRWQAREISFQDQRRERVREFLGKTMTDAEASTVFEGYLHRYEAGWQLFDDAIPTLRRAKRGGLAVAILTNGDRSQQLQKVDRFGLAAEVDLIVCSSDLPAGKPDPRAYAAVLEPLGLTPHTSLMIGDSYEADYEGALRFGMHAVLLDRKGHRSSAADRVRTLTDVSFTR